MRRATAPAFPQGLPSNPEDISTVRSFSDEVLEDEVLEHVGRLDNQLLEYPHNQTDLLFAHVAKHPGGIRRTPQADDNRSLNGE